MKEKMLIVALDFAHKNYLSNHIKVLEKHYQLQLVKVDLDKGISRVYSRRSFITMPFEALYFIYLLLRTKPHYVITVGPKLGLLLSVITRLMPKTRHAHWFTGQVWGGEKRPKRKISFWADYLITKFTSYIFCDGKTQKGIIQKYLKPSKNIYVPKFGSMNGVPDKFFLRKKLENSDLLRVCFVGRKCKDKGILEIGEIARLCEEQNLPVQFLLAGPIDETFKDYRDWKRELLKGSSNVKFDDKYVDPVDIYLCNDILMLPSQREGFGSVVIEAQATGLAVICSNIYGLKDSFVNNETGISCTNDDLDSYVNAIKYLLDKDKLYEMKNNARSFAQKFNSVNFLHDLEYCYAESGLLG